MTTKSHAHKLIRAADVMQRKVFKVEPTTTIEDAVRAFSELHISGAPVVDRNERLVGMLSAFDVARPENVRDGAVQGQHAGYAQGDASLDDDSTYDGDVVFSMDSYSPEALQTGTVEDFMSPDVYSVSSTDHLRDVCRLMVKEHIHRVPVVDAGKLVGIISTLDIVRWVAESNVSE